MRNVALKVLSVKRYTERLTGNPEGTPKSGYFPVADKPGCSHLLPDLPCHRQAVLARIECVSKERVRMKTMLWLSVLIGASLLSAAAPSETQRKYLDQPTVIQGYPCARDYAWFFPDGHLNRCTVSREFDFGETHIPEGSIIELFPDGSLRYVMLKHDTVVGSVRCSGGGPLGPAEGAITVLYPSGKLKSCYLARDEAVQGVPCGSGGFWKATVGHDQAVEFYENGKLKSCRLNQDFANQKRGDAFLQLQ